jgi:hypothetical protein
MGVVASWLFQFLEPLVRKILRNHFASADVFLVEFASSAKSKPKGEPSESYKRV